MTYASNDQMAALRKTLEHKAHAAATAFAPHANGSRLVRGAYDTMTTTLREMRNLASATQVKVDRLEADDLTPEAGKQRLLGETRAEARAEFERLRQKMDGALAVLEDAVHAAALPPVPRDREAHARDEAVMRMSSASDPLQALEEVASLGGELSAVAASSWGESYLVAKGVKPQEARRLHRSVVQVAAINAAMRTGDTPAGRAAQAYFALPEARKAAVIHLNMAADDLKAAGA